MKVVGNGRVVESENTWEAAVAAAVFMTNEWNLCREFEYTWTVVLLVIVIFEGFWREDVLLYVWTCLVSLLLLQLSLL